MYFFSCLLNFGTYKTLPNFEVPLGCGNQNQSEVDQANQAMSSDTKQS
jgi:hypothetical protein